MSTSTSADAIAARYGNDGRAWLDANGVELEELLVSMGAPCEWRDGRGTDVRRYTLADGSAILLAGDCWDVGRAGCWCSATGIAHDERCTIATTASLPPTRECDKCAKRIREGYGTDDGGVSCSLACAGLMQAEYDQMHDEYDNGDGPEPFVYWTEWEESDLPEAEAARAEADTATEPSPWSWWEENDLEMETEDQYGNSVSTLLESRGWTREHTGGGCTGWLFKLHTGESLLLTEAGDPFAVLAFNAPCVVGVYAPEQFGEEPTSYAYCATLDDALLWSALYIAWVAGWAGAKPDSVNAPLRGAV